MLRPTINDYIDALENPTGVFRTLGEATVDRDIYDRPALRAGNSAAVFTCGVCGGGGGSDCLGRSDNPNNPGDTGDTRHFLKCYIRPNPHLRTIYEYIERLSPPLLPTVRLLRDELYVHSLSSEAGWVDVVEGEWIPGETLDREVARAALAGDSVRLGRLADAFDGLCRELLAAEWAHGDLKPENIIVRKEGAGEIAEAGTDVQEAGTDVREESSTPSAPLSLPQLTLIDCDAMWIPALAGCRATELGTPAFRHPARSAEHFDKRIDDYPAVLISVSLHALALAPELYVPDTLILSTDALPPLFAREGRAREYCMTEALALPHPEDMDAKRFFAARTGATKTVNETDVTETDGNATHGNDTDEKTGRAGRLEAFVERGKWGLADEAGRVVVEPFWDEAIQTRAGKAKVRLAEKWRVIEF
jgi:serine/threonine protein kinase